MLVGDLLESIAKRGKAWVDRVIVVDNASGDGSVETLWSRVAELGIDGWVDVLDAGRNAGFGAGNNFGAAAALRAEIKPDVLWFLNPDTLVDGVELRHAMEWFERDERVGVVGTGLDDGGGGRDLGGHRDPSLLGEFVRTGGAFGVLRRCAVSDPSLDRPGEVGWVSGASLMMRASTFSQLGGFDEGFFLYFEEIDLCRRARRAGWSVVYEPRVRVVHLEGQTTGVRKAGARPRYWYESRRRYFVKHFGVLGLLGADVAWGLGRVVGALRRRTGDSCRWGDLWRCDGPVILGRERVLVEGAA
jgi:hypothetical protein